MCASGLSATADLVSFYYTWDFLQIKHIIEIIIRLHHIEIKPTVSCQFLYTMSQKNCIFVSAILSQTLIRFGR